MRQERIHRVARPRRDVEVAQPVARSRRAGGSPGGTDGADELLARIEAALLPSAADRR